MTRGPLSEGLRRRTRSWRLCTIAWEPGVGLPWLYTGCFNANLVDCDHWGGVTLLNCPMWGLVEGSFVLSSVRQGKLFPKTWLQSHSRPVCIPSSIKNSLEKGAVTWSQSGMWCQREPWRGLRSSGFQLPLLSMAPWARHWSSLACFFLIYKTQGLQHEFWL